ncbi:MAG: IS701 family transposase [Acidobacteria bacterium]|nr:IS701 family transposase [Acidobacteriota bacterium]
MAVLKAGREALPDLASFLRPFSDLVVRSESRESIERYTTGLLADLKRKTVSDIGRAVAGTSPQRIQEMLTNTGWEPREMDRLRIGQMLKYASKERGVQIIDDTGFPKKGIHSVGVARQYSGTLGRVDNCQVLVTSHYVDAFFDWPITAQLYLPEGWVGDPARRQKAKIPRAIRFETKGQIALGLVDEGRRAGVPTRAVVADAGYGDQPDFLDGLQKRGLPYVVGVISTLTFRRASAVEADAGDGPSPPYPGRGRPRKTPGLEQRIPAMTALALLADLPEKAWKRITWREGTKGALAKRFARVRPRNPPLGFVYRTGPRGRHRPQAGWLIGERPLRGHPGEAKYPGPARQGGLLRLGAGSPAPGGSGRSGPPALGDRALLPGRQGRTGAR